jgi:hypothetical protein
MQYGSGEPESPRFFGDSMLANIDSAVTTLLILGSIAAIVGCATLLACPKDRRRKPR